jgi:hypothetical protein
MYGVFPTHFAMDPLVIKAVVAAINIAHLVAVEVAQNPVKRSRKRRKVQKEANVDFAPFLLLSLQDSEQLPQLSNVQHWLIQRSSCDIYTSSAENGSSAEVPGPWLRACCICVFGRRTSSTFGHSFSLEEAPFLMSMERLRLEDQMSICFSAMAIPVQWILYWMLVERS